MATTATRADKIVKLLIQVISSVPRSALGSSDTLLITYDPNATDVTYTSLATGWPTSRGSLRIKEKILSKRSKKGTKKRKA